MTLRSYLLNSCPRRAIAGAAAVRGLGALPYAHDGASERLKHTARQLLPAQCSNCSQPSTKGLLPIPQIWCFVKSAKSLAFSQLKLMHPVKIVRHDATPLLYSARCLHPRTEGRD